MKLKRGDFIRVRESSALGRALNRPQHLYFLRVLRTRNGPSNVSPASIYVDVVLLEDISFAGGRGSRGTLRIWSEDRASFQDRSTSFDLVQLLDEETTRQYLKNKRRLRLDAIKAAQDEDAAITALEEELMSTGKAFENYERKSRIDIIERKKRGRAA